MNESLIWIALPAPGPVFGLVMRDGVVVRAPPVARYAIGWRSSCVHAYYAGRGARIVVREPVVDQVVLDDDEH